MGLWQGETPVGEAQFAVYSPGIGLFSLLAAGNGSVSFLKVLSVLNRTFPWVIGCVPAGGYVWSSAFTGIQTESSSGRDSAWI